MPPEDNPADEVWDPPLTYRMLAEVQYLMSLLDVVPPRLERIEAYLIARYNRDEV